MAATRKQTAKPSRTSAAARQRESRRRREQTVILEKRRLELDQREEELDARIGNVVARERKLRERLDGEKSDGEPTLPAPHLLAPIRLAGGPEPERSVAGTIQERLNHHRQALEETHQVIDKLQDRLSPVLQPDEQPDLETAHLGYAGPEASPHAETIAEITAHAAAANDRLARLLARLEL